MVLYIIYRDVKVLKEQLPEHLAAAEKLGEIRIDLQSTMEEITVKEEKKAKAAEKEGAEMSPVWRDPSLMKEKELGAQIEKGNRECKLEPLLHPIFV